jgi:lysophospholipase L1-like esterase
LGSPQTRRAGIGVLFAGLLVAGLAGPLTPTFADNHPGAPPSATDYLALGDSVTFGFREAQSLPTPNYLDASSFVGYPEDVGTALGLRVANASCPGETSTSLIEANVTSHGCENSNGVGPGYRTLFPLHVDYGGTQLQYALQYLRTHPHTGLVTLMIGANDAFLCQETTADHCATELHGVLDQISNNVAHILGAIRQEANYRRQIVIVNYYSLDYSNAADNAGSQALNQAMDSAAMPFDVRIADGFSVLENAATQANGDTCEAGLITFTQFTPEEACGIHPSVTGQALLAQAVEEAIRS